MPQAKCVSAFTSSSSSSLSVNNLIEQTLLRCYIYLLYIPVICYIYQLRLFYSHHKHLSAGAQVSSCHLFPNHVSSRDKERVTLRFLLTFRALTLSHTIQNVLPRKGDIPTAAAQGNNSTNLSKGLTTLVQTPLRHVSSLVLHGRTVCPQKRKIPSGPVPSVELHHCPPAEEMWLVTHGSIMLHLYVFSDALTPPPPARLLWWRKDSSPPSQRHSLVLTSSSVLHHYSSPLRWAGVFPMFHGLLIAFPVSILLQLFL